MPASRARGGRSRERADEVLAGDREQDRQPELVQLVEAAQQLDGLGGVLAEIGAGTDQEPLVRHARRASHLQPLGQQALHVVHHVVVARALELLLRARACMRHDQRRSGRRADLGDLGIDQPAGVVHDRRAGFDRGPGHGGLVGVDGQDRALRRESRDQRGHALDLLPRVDGWAIRDAGLAPDVEQVRALLEQPQPAPDLPFQVPIRAGIGERVGRRVQDPHHERRRSQIKAKIPCGERMRGCLWHHDPGLGYATSRGHLRP